MLQNILKNKLINIIKIELKVKKITMLDGINVTKNWDSVGNLNILLKIEADLQIKFNAKEINSLNNFKLIFQNVKKKYNKKN
jgi:acyl carrier protein